MASVQRAERGERDERFNRSAAPPPVSEITSGKITSGQVIYASIVAFLAWMFSVYDFILFGILLPVIAKDFNWSTEFSTLVATWVSVGTFVVAIMVGPIVDYMGRRLALVVTTAGAALSSGLAALTFNPIYLIVVRSLSGLATLNRRSTRPICRRSTAPGGAVLSTASCRAAGRSAYCSLRR